MSNTSNYNTLCIIWEHAVAKLGDSQQQKREGCVLDSRRCYWNFSGRTMALGSNQPVKEVTAWNISWGVKAAGVWGCQTSLLHVPTV